MIKVDFILREPGNHHLILTRWESRVPRVGDYVTINPDGDTYPVHSVTWDYNDTETTVTLMVGE